MRWMITLGCLFLLTAGPATAIDYDKVERITGMNVTVCTTAETDAEGRALLGHLGMPFRS